MKIIKKISATVLLTVVLVSSLLGINAPEVQSRVIFSDVPDNHIYRNAIYTLLYDGVIDGMKQKDGSYTFDPDGTITRAETVKLITTTLIGDSVSKLAATDKFYDVSQKHWANKYIAFATDARIVSGYGDGSFSPNAPVTYGEVLKMLVCAKDCKDRYKTTDPWYDGYITLAKSLGITQDIVYPGYAYASRALVAQLLYNFEYKKSLPQMHFIGDISEMLTKKDERQIAVKYKSESISFDGYAKIKPQGTSSLAYEKKNYTINLYKDSAFSEKMKVDMGWGKQSKYCLKANWIDKTHARNVVTARLVAQMQKKYNLLTSAPNYGAIDGFPVEIYANGMFLGIYTFNIPKDAWMFAMDEDNPDNIVLGGDDWGPETLFKGTDNLKLWEVEVGEESDATYTKLYRLLSFVKNSSDAEFKAHFGEYLDLDATLNYYVMTDYAYLLDNLGKNMLIATYDGKKWYPSLYDLDSSFGADTSGTGLFSYQQYLIGFDYNNLFNRLEKCFSKELAQRYFELRQDVLNENNVIFKFRAFMDSIPESVYAKELTKWGPNIPGYGLSQIEAYLDYIVPKLDMKYGHM